MQIKDPEKNTLSKNALLLELPFFPRQGVFDVSLCCQNEKLLKMKLQQKNNKQEKNIQTYVVLQ